MFLRKSLNLLLLLRGAVRSMAYQHVHDVVVEVLSVTRVVTFLLTVYPVPNPHPGSCYTGLRVLRRHDS